MTAPAGEARFDSRNPAVLDDHRRRAALRLGGVDDQMAGLDRIGFGVGRGRGDQRGGAGKQIPEH
jgi:hypothetical protein